MPVTSFNSPEKGIGGVQIRDIAKQIGEMEITEERREVGGFS